MFAQRRVRRRPITAVPYARPPDSASISRAQSEYSHQSTEQGQQPHRLTAASVALPVTQSNPVVTVASEKRRLQMLTWPAQTVEADHMLRQLPPLGLQAGTPIMQPLNQLAGPAGATANHFSFTPNLCPPSLGVYTQQQTANISNVTVSSKTSCICRFCNCTLSSSSNRHRHERLKHAAELQFMPHAPTAGSSRKQSTETAFSKPAASVMSGSEMRVEAHPANSGVTDTEQNIHPPAADSEDPVQEAIIYADAGHGGQEATAVPPASESKEEEEEAKQNSVTVDQRPPPPQSGVFAGEDGGPSAAAALDHRDESEHKAEATLDGLPARDHGQQNGQLQAEVVSMEADPDPVAAGVLLAAGARPLLQVESLQTAAYSFMQWLASPCMTATEALVKGKRVKSTSQLAPIKNTLKFLFALLYDSNAIEAIDLKVLLRLSVVQALYQAVVDRQVSSGRMHQIFLLVKKVLVFLSSTESAKSRQFVQPTAYESYLYVENVCSESSDQRKQEARNRMVLGIPGARGALVQQREVFQIPKTWSESGNPLPLRLPAAAAAPGAAEVQTDTMQLNGPNHTMTREELSAVTQACLDYLRSSVAFREVNPLPADSDVHFMHYLITATLCLGLAPRSQVLQQLRIGSSFKKEADGLYWIRMRAQESKNGRPTMFALAQDLTFAYDHYLQEVRPRLLARSVQGGLQHDYVFFKRSGAAPRTDFSTSTCLVTQQVLGRPVNCHSFRASLITTFFNSGASDAEMCTLASIMAHDPSTQRNFYYKPQHNQAAKQAGQRMVDQLLQPSH
jgi:integrase/N-acetylmuramoyl-L-alanine amidase